ncbi:hypothetical protein TBS_24420 [Thermobispora bispora]
MSSTCGRIAAIRSSRSRPRIDSVSSANEAAARSARRSHASSALPLATCGPAARTSSPADCQAAANALASQTTTPTAAAPAGGTSTAHAAPPAAAPSRTPQGSRSSSVKRDTASPGQKLESTAVNTWSMLPGSRES